jgi:flagellar biosynthetic protein FliP
MGILETATQTDGFQELATPLQLALFLGGMVLLAGALVSVTAFTRIVIVLSFVRRALSVQEIPPNPVIIGLSLFLTLFVMGPTINLINSEAITPLVNKEIGNSEAIALASDRLREFMLQQTRPADLLLFIELANEGEIESSELTPMRILIPAFIVSELKTAFIMGFCIYVPFLLIDLVVSTVLMSLGMMMMPPVIVSTPCKIMLFVLVDGWHLVAFSLSNSFAYTVHA